MGPQEAPGPVPFVGIRAWRLLWFPASPEVAFGQPMMETHGGLRVTAVISVSPWWIYYDRMRFGMRPGRCCPRPPGPRPIRRPSA